MSMLKDFFMNSHKKVSISARTCTQKTTELCVEVGMCFIYGWGLNFPRQGPLFDTFLQQPSSHSAMCEALKLWLRHGFFFLLLCFVVSQFLTHFLKFRNFSLWVFINNCFCVAAIFWLFCNASYIIYCISYIFHFSSLLSSSDLSVQTAAY